MLPSPYRGGKGGVNEMSSSQNDKGIRGARRPPEAD